MKARICRMAGISSHADCAGLLTWIGSFEKKPKKIFVVHGEDQVCTLFAEKLKEAYQLDAMAPYSGTVYDLKEEACIVEGKPVRIAGEQICAHTPKQARGNTVYARLWAAGQRLLTVIRHNEGGANKDLAKLTSQINSLCDKWDR